MAVIESRVPPLVLTRSGNAGRASMLLSACLSRLPVQLCCEYMTVMGGCQGENQGGVGIRILGGELSKHKVHKGYEGKKDRDVVNSPPIVYFVLDVFKKMISTHQGKIK